METTITTPTSPPLSHKSAMFIVNILTPASHNNPQYRVASELCPGKRGSGIRASELVKYGYAELLRIRLAQLMAESGAEGVKKECDSMDADVAAENGHLDVVRDLRDHGVHCSHLGADWAAMNGHVEVIRDLRAHGI